MERELNESSAFVEAIEEVEDLLKAGRTSAGSKALAKARD